MYCLPYSTNDTLFDFLYFYHLPILPSLTEKNGKEEWNRLRLLWNSWSIASANSSIYHFQPSTQFLNTFFLPFNSSHYPQLLTFFFLLFFPLVFVKRDYIFSATAPSLTNILSSIQFLCCLKISFSGFASISIRILWGFQNVGCEVNRWDGIENEKDMIRDEWMDGEWKIRG